MLEASNKGFEVRRVYDYEDGMVSLSKHRVDLVMLDSVTPDSDGVRLLEYMRAQPDFANLPAMVLTNNAWPREPRGETRFVVHQREGLYPAEILKFLNAVVAGLSPRYYSAMVANLESHIGAEGPSAAVYP